MIASEDGVDGEDEQSGEEWSQVVNDVDEGRWSQIIDMVANHWYGRKSLTWAGTRPL